MASDSSTAIDQAVISLTSFRVEKAGSLPGNLEKPSFGVIGHEASTITTNAGDQNKSITTQSNHMAPSNGSPHGIHKNVLSTSFSPPAGHQPSRVFFARPQSSGDGVAAGFSFGKAKPTTMNMSRQFGQASRVPTAEASMNEAAVDVKTVMDTSPDEMDRTITGVTPTVQPRYFPLTDDYTTTATSQSPTHKAQSVALPRHSSEPPPKAKDTTSPLTKITETVTDTYVSPPRHQSEADICSVVTAGQEPALFDTEPFTELEKPPTPRHLHRPVGRSNPSTPKEPRLPAQARSKVTKSRRKTLPKPSDNSGPPEIGGTKSTPTQEELMNVLLLRYKHDKQIRHQERVAHVIEVQDFKDITDHLWQQLQAERAKGQQLDKEVLDFQAKMPAWSAKVKKLIDFVRGLTNDHHGLRDKAKEIQQNQKDLRHQKVQLNAELENINQHLDATTNWTKDTVVEAKTDLRLLLQQSQNQQTQLQDNVRLLDSERERNKLYAAEIGKLTTSHNKLTQFIAVQDGIHLDRLTTLSAKIDDIQINNPSDSHEELKSVVQQCLDIVESLRSPVDIKIEDLHYLDTSVRGYADSITKSIQAYQQDVKAFGLGSQKSVSGMQQQLLAMSDNAEEQRFLVDQHTGNCVAKAALEERIHVAEAALAESRQEVAVTQETKARLQQQITALENEAANLRDQTKDSTAIIERLTEMNGQNKALEAQVKAFQEVSVTASRKLQERLEDYANMQLKLEDKESQLKELQDRSITQAEEQAASIRHAFEKHEEDKKHIRLQAKFERDAMDARHRIQINDLEHKLTLADEQFMKHVEALDQLRADKQLADQAVIKQVAVLAQLQNDNEAADAAAEERSEQLDEAIADKETAQKLAIDRQGQLQKIAADLTREESLVCTYKDSLSKLDTQLEERESKIARLNQSMNQAVEELEGNYARIDDLEKANLQLDNEAREARHARRRAEDLYTDEARKATAALKDLEDYKAANPPHSQEFLDEFRTSNVNSPLKPKREAHRSDVHRNGRTVQDSQSQLVPDLSPAHPVTPRGSVNVFDEQFEDDEDDDQPLHDIASLFPPTPDLSSQIVRPTVKFVSDSMDTRSHYASQSRDRFASDYLPSEYISMSQVEGSQEPPHGAIASVKSTASASRRIAPVQADSQPSQPSGHPRSILKSSRPIKRSAEAAGLPTTEREPRRRGGLRAESQSLGPVIPESQSKNGSQSQARSRRLSRPAAPKSKGDKFSRRFSNELARDPS